MVFFSGKLSFSFKQFFYNKVIGVPRLCKISQGIGKTSVNQSAITTTVTSTIESKGDSKTNEFDLETFKREFINSTDQTKVLDSLVKTIKNEKYSFWFMHYIKDTDQGVDFTRTKNLHMTFMDVDWLDRSFHQL